MSFTATMNKSLALGVTAGLLLCSCAEQTTHIANVREVPLKDTDIPSMDTGFHRSQATYLLYGAYSQELKLQRLGQYYFITWHDSQPDEPLSMVMLYRQGKSGSKVLTKTVALPAGRDGGEEKTLITFIGDEAKTKGSVLSWKIQLKDRRGKVLSEKRSFLWTDKD